VQAPRLFFILDMPKIFPATGDPQLHFYRHFPTKAWFEYHCWESKESEHAELWKHTHQQVTVLRMLTPAESDYEMYRVQFADKFQSDVFADELVRSPKSFQRPDYLKVEEI